MKIFRVVTEHDGETTKRTRKDFVWDNINWLLIDEEKTVVAIVEEHPLFAIIKPKEQEEA